MFLLLVVVVATCVLLAPNVEARKRKGAKMMKRRITTIVKDLENNVTALWKEVDMLSQPVHVHLHGDDHVIDPDHAHHHHHQDHQQHSHGKSPQSPDDENDDEADDKDGEHMAQHDAKHPHSHKHHHKDDDNDDDDDDAKHMMGGDDSDDEDMIKVMKMKMRMTKMKHKQHHSKCRGCKRPGHMEGDSREDEEEEMEWKEKWMHGGRKGTHVHIHLHTGEMDGEMESEDHHTEPSLPQEYRYARCDVVGNSALPLMDRQDIKGAFHFRHMPGQPLEVKASLKGFVVKVDKQDNAGQKLHLRGLHGHEYGDMSNGCNSLGGHLNPSGVTHGGPGAAGEHRHVGDFGNLEVKEDGTVMTSFTDDVASLFGSDSMLGRSLVIHAGPDDLGHGDSKSSKASGNAGGRIACCIVVASSEPSDIWSSQQN